MLQGEAPAGIAPPAPLVFNIARGSLHDGPGIRTVVYFKGCTMKCRWCHNPEGISAAPQLFANAGKCIKCGRCTVVCPRCHQASGGGEISHIRDSCTGCGRCAGACPNGALAICGETWGADGLMAEILKDSHYYEASNGGATFSGGECLLYPQFLAGLLWRCGGAGVHTAVETALNVPWANVEPAIPLTGLFLADVKHMDGAAHRRHTGAGNGLILKNLERLSARHHNVVVRVPLVPSVNDSTENICRTAEFAYKACGAKGVELLKYNPLAESKYGRLGMRYEGYGAEPQGDGQLDRLCEAANRAVGADGYVYYSRE